MTTLPTHGARSAESKRGSRIGHPHRRPAPDLVLELVGLDCADCALTLERAVEALDGVSQAHLDFGTALLEVWTDGHAVPEKAVVAAVGAAGYSARPAGADPRAVAGPGWIRQRRDRLTVVAGLMLVAGWVLDLLYPGTHGPVATYLAAMALAGYGVSRSAFLAVRARRALDMNVLMTVAALGALGIGEWSEGATAMVLFGIGNMLEGHTTDRARVAVRKLLLSTPPLAVVRRKGGETSVPIADLLPGDIVIVRPGERVPADGQVTAGGTAINESMLTGEPMPVDKRMGDPVYAGTINGHGSFEARVSSLASDTAVARIVQMVEAAQSSKAHSQRFVDRFSAVYTPAVIAGAVVVAVVGPMLTGQPAAAWFGRALVLLVIACPCALVLSTPVTIVSAIAAAARRGVLIKGGAHLETLGRLDTIAMDKTGTLTEGRPIVTDVVAFDGENVDSVLALAAATESRSEHPLGRVIVHEARHRSLVVPSAAAFGSEPGRGVRARVDGRWITVGAHRLLAGTRDLPPVAVTAIEGLEGEGKTVVLIARDGVPIGAIALADQLRPQAAELVRALKADGIRRIVMLTGDNPTTARVVAERVGISEVRSGLLPGEKADAIVSLSRSSKAVGMIGDGVNDAPALAAAAVGIAISEGRLVGSDAALESADVVVMGGDLDGLVRAIGLGRLARRTVAANIAFALAVKAIFLAMAAGGLATLWMAVLADVGTSLLVVVNGMRLLAGTRGPHSA